MLALQYAIIAEGLREAMRWHLRDSQKWSGDYKSQVED